MSPSELQQHDLQQLGAELGLDAVGATPAVPYERTERNIAERKARGLFADMKFTMAQPERSCHPETLLPGARTVVSAALCYYAPEPERPAGHGRLPRYTWDDGYAELRTKLDALGQRLGGTYRVLVDANQHVDREAAARSGVGFYGKNTLLITRRHGSWVVLGTLVTDVELEATPPLPIDCGECRLCIDACPTDALDEPGTLDATRGLSYWTQAPAAIPEDYREKLGAHVYGCDICQDVCPWNRGIEKRRAGVGFYGKNTLLITRRYGSWVVVGTLVTEVEIDATPPLELDCGSCTLCIEACPTDALAEPGVLDSTKCLSYWTQAPAPIPDEFRADLGDQVYGCDICQDVCPWNRGVEKRRADVELSPEAEPVVSLVDWLEAEPDELRRRYDRLYVPRNDPRYLRRNALVALGNSGREDLAPLAEPFLEGEDELLREQATWALARLSEHSQSDSSPEI